MKKIIAIISAIGVLSLATQAQVLLSGGLTYSQNFDTLTTTTTSAGWANNSTLPAWYANRAYTGGTSGPLGSYAYGSYRYGDGLISNSGWIYSYGMLGINPITDRALGSISSGTPKTNAFGVRILNDTADPVGNITVSFTGEQWRMGAGNVDFPNTLYFSYKTGSTMTDPAPNDADASASTWTFLPSAYFTSPIMATTTSDAALALDGNASANRNVFTPFVLTGVTLTPGAEIFLRWTDHDESGNDMGLGIDDLSVSFSVVPEPSVVALGGFGLLTLVLWRRRS